MLKFYRKNVLIVIVCIGLSIFFASVVSANRNKKIVNHATNTIVKGKCGVERWPVKTASDVDAHYLLKTNGELKTAKKKTIEDLIFLPFPFPNPNNLPQSSYTHRVHPYEENIIVVEATLIEYKREADRDYHLIIQDDAGNTMIAELADISCVKSPIPAIKGAIQQARLDFDAKFTASGSFQSTSTPVRITGVPFFDRPHDQKGSADNGIEIHPVLKIEFP